MPCSNNLYLIEISEAIKIINKLETSLLCTMLTFKKVVITTKGKSPKLIGIVVNVIGLWNKTLMDVNETFDKFPNCNHIVLMKRKKTLMYKGHVFLNQSIQKKFTEL